MTLWGVDMLTAIVLIQIIEDKQVLRLQNTIKVTNIFAAPKSKVTKI